MKSRGLTAWVGIVVAMAGTSLGACVGPERQVTTDAWVEVDVGAAASPSPAPLPAPRAPTRALWIDEDDSPWASLPIGDGSAVAYDCRGVHPRRAPRAPAVSASTAELVRRVDPASSEWLSSTPELSAALTALRSTRPEELSPFERVVVQNTALSVIARMSEGEDVAAARELVARFALPAATLEALGSEPESAAELFLGPRITWTDRKGAQCGEGRLLRHDRMYRGVRSFRPLRIGDTRALVAQLVALDTDGEAHVTPVVGEIELLRGASPALSACIVELSPDGLELGAPGGLRRVTQEHAPRTRFVKTTTPGFMSCATCHGGSGVGDFADVAPAEALTLGVNRRAASADLVQTELAVSMPWR
ncbi:MAG: hypothetical protein U0414_30710 [Polyangiaceae bacterium]